MPKLQILFVFAFSAAVVAQSPTPAPQLSPNAAYEKAIHPLELTRNSMSNWSETEIAALALSMGRAKVECDARDPDSYSGADLVDLAKLCALSQEFPAVIEAASRYIAADGPKPLLAQAYARLIDAQLHAKDEPAALHSTLAMLAAVPYDTLTAETVDEAISFMQFLYTPDALKLAVAREPDVISQMSAQGAHGTTPAAGSDAEAAQSLHALYADGLTLAALQQLERAPADAVAETLHSLDAALPSQIGPDNAIPMELLRRRYALLGKPLPSLDRTTQAADGHQPVPTTTLDVGVRRPEIPAKNAITALLLFPDWCAACVRMDAKAPQTVFTVAGHEAYVYGLMAETVAPDPPANEAIAPSGISAANAANYLRGTPTLLVDPSLLDAFAVDDVPFLVITDAQGIIRVIQPVGDDALNPGGTIDSAIAHVGATWPSPRLVAPAALHGAAK